MTTRADSLPARAAPVDSPLPPEGTHAAKDADPPLSALVVQERLAQSESRYRRLFEAARDGILLLDLENGRITDANPAMTTLLGYSHAEFLTKELWQIGVFADKDASDTAFQELREKRYLRYEDKPLQTAGGDTCEVEFVSNVYHENGHAVIQCHIRDISGRKRVERALNAALVRELVITEALQHPLTVAVEEEAFPHLRVATYYEPALKEAEVGGDFHDAFSFQSRRKRGGDPDRVAFAVGDVTGKGVLAAAFGGRVRDVMRAFLRENHDPAQTLLRLNDYLCDTVSSAGYSHDLSLQMPLLALSLVVVNPRTGIAAISSAGAEPPVILRADGTCDVIAEGGALLGVQPDLPYTVRRIHLRVGDTLLMTTDGLTEVRQRRAVSTNAAPHRVELLGYEGMLTLAQKHQNLPSLNAMSQAIVREARSFGGEFRDDVCLVLVRRR